MSDPMPTTDADGARSTAADDVVRGEPDSGAEREAVRQLIAAAVPERVPRGVAPPANEQEPDTRGALEALMEAVLSDPDRVAALGRTGLLDGPPRRALDQFAALVAEALGTRYAAVSLVDADAQTLVGRSDVAEGSERRRPLEQSICRYAVASGEPLIVDDTSEHPLLAGSPLVQDGSVRSYAGIPLADQGGHAVGTLCAWDSKPRHWTGSQIQILQDLSAVARTKIFGG